MVYARLGAEFFKKAVYYLLKNKNGWPRFCNDKAFERLLEIWAKIIKVNKDWKLYLIGDGALRPIYEKIIEKYNMKDYVILTGFLSNSDTLNLIKKSIVSLVPSLFLLQFLASLLFLLCRLCGRMCKIR